MRNFLLLGLGLLVAYWLDQTFYDGTYSRPLVDMLNQIILAFR